MYGTRAHTRAYARIYIIYVYTRNGRNPSNFVQKKKKRKIDTYTRPFSEKKRISPSSGSPSDRIRMNRFFFLPQNRVNSLTREIRTHTALYTRRFRQNANYYIFSKTTDIINIIFVHYTHAHDVLPMFDDLNSTPR